ncbi:LysE family translocator [Pelagibacterium xiamenense]|uniref:LysE family translocator n=1 Tax=Pelagibacterium xiamenense TaxID=2901140 RepID=UPI001E49D671|nr:LysE family translocator [Pelagibacterium xiamenense]MCD7058714.1 LysE family translocator [Pelagibacterium xiamenense]
MIEPAILLPYLAFCIVMSGTPGPNNTMALTSGVRVGLWRSMPLVAGIALGVALQLLAIGLGLGAIFDAVPALHDVLRICGSVYLLWLAIKIARSGPVRPAAEDRPPVGFAGAAAFQWVNPKAWAITTSAAAAYLPAADYLANVGVAAVIMALVAIPCVSAWAACGTVLRRFLVQPGYARAFNITAALLLVAAIGPILFGTRAA